MILASFLRSLLVPPALNILLVLLGLWLLRRRRLWPGRLLIAFSLVSLWLLATPLGAGFLAAGLEQDDPLNVADKSRWQAAQAIVVLGGGRDVAPEFGGMDVPNYWTASRLRYAAWLYRQTGLPLAVSGGIVRASEKETEAAVMTRSLLQDFIVNVRWQEGRSRTTWENAEYSHELLAPQGVKTIVLVTQSLHMRRSRMIFEHFGFEVVPAPIDFDAEAATRPWLLQLAPNLMAFVRSAQSLHEYGGLLRYRLRMVMD
ncbi:MAG: YdcF family protein [Moraxellaceae bacterium]